MAGHERLTLEASPWKSASSSVSPQPETICLSSEIYASEVTGTVWLDEFLDLRIYDIDPAKSGYVAMQSIANDDDVLTLNDAEALLGEIRRLSAEVVRLEAQVRELEELAHTDSMLNLLNRRAFVICLESLIARVERHGVQAAMLFVDVDNLKPVNDGLGHNAGDAALAKVGQLLSESVRKSDCVARIGGDEFGILLEKVGEVDAWQMSECRKALAAAQRQS